MAERFFTKIANDVLEATETIANNFDDGWNQVFSNMKEGNPSPSPTLDDDDLDDILKDSPLQGMAEQVIQDIMDGSAVGPQSFWEHINAFRSAITWSEPFIIGLIIFQIFMFSCTVYVSRPSVDLMPRVVLLVVIGIIVRTAEYTNEWAAQNWRELGITQNYFDARGLFMAIMLSAPLLLNSLIMLLCFVREAKNLLVEVKTKQILQKRAAKKKTESKVSQRRAKKEQ